MRHRSAFPLLILFGLVGILGCGYTVGYRLPEGVETLAVPVFANETFPLRRDIEIDLTRAVKREIDNRMDVRLVRSAAADAVLEGVIVEFNETVLTEGPRDSVTESGIQISVLITLTRSSNETVLFEQVITDSAEFSVLAGETIDDARQVAVGRIAQRIVAELEFWD